MARNDAATRAAKEIANSCHAVRLRALNRAVSSIYDEALRPLGLKASQLNVLVAIASAGQLQPVDIGRALHMEKSTVSRNVDKMKVNGWIQSRDLEGRGQVLSLTTTGNRLVARAAKRWKMAQTQTEELLGTDGVAALREVHERL